MRKSESMIHSCSRGRYHKFIVWVLMLGVVIFGAMAQSALANFEGGGTSGQFAKLEFRLRESFHPTSIAWSPDGRYIATGSTDSREIHIWEVSRRRKKAGGWNGRVWFFGSGDRVPSRSIRAYRAGGGGGGAVHSLTVDPGGQFIVTGAKTGAGNQSAGFATESVHILNTSDGSLVAAPLDRLPPLKFGSEEGLAYSHDRRYIIVAHGGDEGWIHILDGRTFKAIDVVESNAYNYDVAVNQANDDFAVATNRQVIVWSLPERQ